MLVSKDVTLIYTNAAAQTLSMSFQSHFFPLECREQLQSRISSEKGVNRDGEIFTNLAADIRHIDINGYFNAASGRRAMEGQLKRVFSISGAGTLEYHNARDSTHYTITAYPEAVPDVNWQNMRVEFAVSLTCLDPYWYGDEKTVTGSGSPLPVTNIGDIYAGAVYELTGSAVNPYVKIGDKAVAFIGSISGQTLRITAMPEKSFVDIGGVNNMRYLTDANRRAFPLLAAGSNSVAFGADSGSVSLAVKFKPRFYGAF